MCDDLTHYLGREIGVTRRAKKPRTYQLVRDLFEVVHEKSGKGIG